VPYSRVASTLAGRWRLMAKRIKLANPHAIVDAIHSGALIEAQTERDPTFDFEVVTDWLNVPAKILIPHNVWANQAVFEAMAKKSGTHFSQKLRNLRRRCQRRGQSRRTDCTGIEVQLHVQERRERGNHRRGVTEVTEGIGYHVGSTRKRGIPIPYSGSEGLSFTAADFLLPSPTDLSAS
jgi:hypothetical protein